MADTLTRRSPLKGWESRFAVLPASTNISEEPFVAMVDLWVEPTGPGVTACAEVLGVPALPTTPSTAVEGPDANVIWFGPQEWLVTSTSQAAEALEAQLREVTTEHGGAAVDVSAQRTTVRLCGAHARDVLAKGCSLDLHPAVFGPGAAAQPMLGHVTSSYRSAELGRPFALALVKGGHARIGDTLHVPVDGTLVPVEVTASVLVDPEGARRDG